MRSRFPPEHRARPRHVTGNDAHLLAGLERQRHEPGSDPSGSARDRDHRLSPVRSLGGGREKTGSYASRPSVA
jgi:hypothetical protein